MKIDNNPNEDVTEQFYAINRAFEVLNDPQLKKLYDSFGEDGIGTSAASDERVNQESIEREYRTRTPFQRHSGARPEDVCTTADSFFKRGPPSRPNTASGGSGSGVRGESRESICRTCGGTGEIEEIVVSASGSTTRRGPCPSCAGVDNWDVAEVRGKSKFTDERAKAPETPTRKREVDIHSTGTREEGKKSCYDILGVPKTTDTAGIKEAYRMLAKLYHPGKFLSFGMYYQSLFCSPLTTYILV